MGARAGVVAVGLVIVGLTVAAAGTPPETRCTERKERAAARKAAGLLDCQAKTEPSPPDPSCVAKVRQRFAEAWAKIELRGGCPTPGDVDAVEAKVDAFVADVVAELHTATTTTVTATTSTSCPPATAFYCNFNTPACDLTSLCPGGQQCTGTTGACACTGPSIACGDPQLRTLNGAFCQWGTCPSGMTCGAVAIPGQCGFDCACH